MKIRLPDSAIKIQNEEILNSQKYHTSTPRLKSEQKQISLTTTKSTQNVNGKRIYAPWSSVTLFPAPAKEQLKEYGVFLGINEGDSAKLKQYKLVVIEPSEFSVQKDSGMLTVKSVRLS